MANFRFTSVMDDEIQQLINKKLEATEKKLDDLMVSIETTGKQVKEKAELHESNMAAKAAQSEEQMSDIAVKFQKQAQDKIDSIDPRLQKLETTQAAMKTELTKTINDRCEKVENNLSAANKKIGVLESWRNKFEEFHKAYKKILGNLLGE